MVSWTFPKNALKGSPDGPNGQFWASYGSQVYHNEFDKLEGITYVIVNNFGFMNSPKTASKRSPVHPNDQIWAGYGLHVDHVHDEVDQLQVFTIIAVTNFGYMNFPKNCTQGLPRWSRWPILGWLCLPCWVWWSWSSGRYHYHNS